MNKLKSDIVLFAMESFRKFLKIHTALQISVRHRGKINIQKPRKPHFERQKLIDFTKPVYGPSNKSLPQSYFCNKYEITKKDIDNPFERILARECLEKFNNSKMIVFLHLNSISMEDKMPLFGILQKNKMRLASYGKKIVSMATKGTRYEIVNHLFCSHQHIIFGQPENANKMFKILKKTPQLVVMAGIIEDRLLSKNELVEFSQLPSLDVARSHLCSVLDSSASNITSQMNQGQQTLVSYLDKHVEIAGQE